MIQSILIMISKILDLNHGKNKYINIYIFIWILLLYKYIYIYYYQ